MVDRITKPRKCSLCKQPAKYGNSVNAWCSHEHGAQLAMRAKAKADKRKESAQKAESRAAKEAVKTRRELMAEAQKEFNAYIRARDYGKPCISCGALFASQWDAGHYRSTGAASHLRFNEDNVHRQCSRPCNKDKSGDLINYRIGLVARIGESRVVALENDNSTAHWTADEIRAIKVKYAKMRKAIEADRVLR